MILSRKQPWLSGSRPSVAENLTFAMFSLRTLDEEVCAACGLSE